MSSTFERVGTHFLLIIFAVIAVYPLISIVTLSLTPSNEIVTGFSLPSEVTFDNYATAWRDGRFESCSPTAASYPPGRPARRPPGRRCRGRPVAW